MNQSNRRNPGIYSLALILTLVAIYAFILGIPSRTAVGSHSFEHKVGKENVVAATQGSYQPPQVTAGEDNYSDAHPSMLASLKVVVPVSAGVNCASCHCDPRDASIEYPVYTTKGVMTDTLTVQDFLKESQYVPLLVQQRPVFCGSGHASLPGHEEDHVIHFLQSQAQPGT